MNPRLTNDFFARNVLEVASGLPGKIICRRFDNGSVGRYRITETEAYAGTTDLACHSSKGKTPRTEVMFGECGRVYVYLIYGMYWMLNFVTGDVGDASAVLIRGIDGASGPGRVGKKLMLDKSFYGENLDVSERLWVENSNDTPPLIATPRIGINYAGEPWVSKPWRFVVKNSIQ
ncbi:MAG: 3-methyladenine DNA glycosylase [Draconibacterium sp.]|nr:MAG: 3-methyladenine DNA glycosylase [Draconibacterium sp.]